MKYMMLTFGSQDDYDGMAGKGSATPAWTSEDFAALGAFMQAFNQELVDSGELVETRGLSAPVHARRVRLRDGVPVVSDGPYAEAEEVLAGYWVLECESFESRPPRSPAGSRSARRQNTSGHGPTPTCDRSMSISPTSRADRSMISGELEDLLRRLAPGRRPLGPPATALRLRADSPVGASPARACSSPFRQITYRPGGNLHCRSDI